MTLREVVEQQRQGKVQKSVIARAVAVLPVRNNLHGSLVGGGGGGAVIGLIFAG